MTVASLACEPVTDALVRLAYLAGCRGSDGLVDAVEAVLGGSTDRDQVWLVADLAMTTTRLCLANGLDEQGEFWGDGDLEGLFQLLEWVASGAGERMAAA